MNQSRAKGFPNRSRARGTEKKARQRNEEVKKHGGLEKMSIGCPRNKRGGVKGGELAKSNGRGPRR